MSEEIHPLLWSDEFDAKVDAHMQRLAELAAQGVPITEPLKTLRRIIENMEAILDIHKQHTS